MNTALAFLSARWQQLGLTRYGTPDQLSCVVVTPRFRASSHVVFLLLADGRPDPVLVAKVPRLAGASASIEREVANLRAVQAVRPGGFDSIPRVIAFEDYCGHPILVETALVGQPMDRQTLRRDLIGCCETVTRWLTEVQHQDRKMARAGGDGFEHLVEQPMRYFANVFPLSSQEARLLERTRELVEPLHGARLPFVIEHGDLCHPNLLLLKGGDLGAVDWELADPQGLPACDLFFFLTYAAFALHNADDARTHEAAFHQAFFGPSAWARPYVRAYVKQLQLQQEWVTPLFILCWLRYMVGLLARLGEGERVDGKVGVETAAWLRTNRYYRLWQHTLAHLQELEW